MEWKAIQIDFLDIPKPRQSSRKASKMPVRLSGREAKALILREYTLEKVLSLKFSENDIFRPGRTIKQWIEEEAAPQLKKHIASKEVKAKLKEGGSVLKADLVVIVGSRHVLLWDMDHDGELAEMPRLVGVNS